MLYPEIILSLLIFLLGLRTLGWHLQCWQLREYRFDRMRAWLNTVDGKQFWVPWFYPGLLPRPKLSGRMLLILSVWLIANLALLALILSSHLGCLLTEPSASLCFPTTTSPSIPLWLLLWERTIWLQAGLVIGLSKFPVWLGRKKLFNQAYAITSQADPAQVVKIGITGSYGKSSTKEILVHLLKAEFGETQVLYNPANENNEVAIARLIKRHKAFFQSTPSALQASPPKPGGENNRKFFVAEMGAYRAGDIAQMCCFCTPCYGILTGLNQQHVELFGSFETIKNTKFELAEAAGKTVFFNADNPHLQQVFAERRIVATPVPLGLSAVKKLKAFPDRTEFELYGQAFVLPWPGEFFVQNALLALECAREMGLTPKALAAHLKTLPPLERALNLTPHPQGFHLLRDTYSANLDGVLQAIEHLKHFPGKRLFVSIPLRELGESAETAHQQIFEKLRDLEAEVYWEKTDFADLGKAILGGRFHQINPLTKSGLDDLQTQIKSLKKGDVVLLESKLAQKTIDLF